MQQMRAITMIEIKGRAAQIVLDKLRGYPEVRALHSTNGRWDIVAELETDSLQNFDLVLRSIRLIEGIANTETSIYLSSHKF